MNHVVINTLEEFNQLIDFLQAHVGILAFDLETDSVDEVLAKIYGVGLALHEDEGYYIPIRAKDGSYFFSPEQTEYVYGKLTELLAKSKLLGHNIIYDILVYKSNTGVNLTSNVYADTILMKHTVDEEPPFGLKDLAVREFGEGADLAQQELYDNIKANGGSITKTNMEMFKADTEVLGKYCAHDCMLTHKLFNLYSRKIEAEGLLQFFYEEEVMPLYREVTIPMKMSGVSLDIELLTSMSKDADLDLKKLENEVMEEIHEIIEEYEANYLNDNFPVKTAGNFPKAYAKVIGLGEITSMSKKAVAELQVETELQHEFKAWMQGEVFELTGPTEDAQYLLYFNKTGKEYVFNLNSKAQLKWLFFEKLGLDPLNKTETGEPQVDDAFLESIVKQYPWVGKIRDINTISKMKGTYLDGMVERAIDGKIYTSFLQFGTTSGRFASRNPNLQNAPSHQNTGSIVDKYVNCVRASIIAKPGYKLIGADFCLHPKTELLTKDRGWVPVLEIEPTDYVWQIEKDTLHGSWAIPSRIIKREFTGNMYTFGNRRGSLTVTENHRMLWTGQYHVTRKDKERLRIETLSQAGIPITGCNLLTGSITDGTVSNFSEEEIWVACLLKAYGNTIEDKPNAYNIQVSIDKKRQKVRELLGVVGGECPVGHGSYVKFQSPLFTDKFLNVDLIGNNQIDILVDALAFWEGYYTGGGRFTYATTDKEQAEAIQRKLTSNNCEVSLKLTGHNCRYVYNLSIRKKTRIRLRKQDVKVSDYSGMVGCVTVPTGYIAVRSDGQTFVTGNCSLEPHIAAYVSGDPDLIDIFVTGKDFYSAIAIKQFKLEGLSPFKGDPNYLGDLDKKTRNTCKVFSLSVFYGASGYRVGETLNIPAEDGNKLVEGYLDSFPGIRKFINNSHYEACTKGYVKTIFGRVRHLQEAKDLFDKYGHNLLDAKWARSKGLSEERRTFKNLMNNAVNFQIQGTAGHVMNRAMMLTNRMFKDNNIDARIVMTIHDEQIVEVKEDQAEVAAEIIRWAMENAVSLDPIKLKATPIIGNNYGECK